MGNRQVGGIALKAGATLTGLGTLATLVMFVARASNDSSVTNVTRQFGAFTGQSGAVPSASADPLVLPSATPVTSPTTDATRAVAAGQALSPATPLMRAQSPGPTGFAAARIVAGPPSASAVLPVSAPAISLLQSPPAPPLSALPVGSPGADGPSPAPPAAPSSVPPAPGRGGAQPANRSAQPPVSHDVRSAPQGDGQDLVPPGRGGAIGIVNPAPPDHGPHVGDPKPPKPAPDAHTGPSAGNGLGAGPDGPGGPGGQKPHDGGPGQG